MVSKLAFAAEVLLAEAEELASQVVDEASVRDLLRYARALEAQVHPRPNLGSRSATESRFETDKSAPSVHLLCREQAIPTRSLWGARQTPKRLVAEPF